MFISIGLRFFGYAHSSCGHCSRLSRRSASMSAGRRRERPTSRRSYETSCSEMTIMSFRLTSQDQIHTYGTRHNYIIPANVTRTQFAQNCLRNKLPMVINSSEPNIIQKIDTHSYKGLSWYLKTITTRNYSFICNIENCYIICTNDS